MNIGQAHTQDSQRMAVNSISQMLIKENAQGYMHPAFLQWRQAYLLMCTSCLQVIKHLRHNWSNQICLQKWKHVPCYLKWTTAPRIPGSCLFLNKWGLQVRGILIYRFLKHSNLNLKDNFSPHSLILASCRWYLLEVGMFWSHPRCSQ